ACYYGHDIDLPGLRRRAALSLKGASLKRVIEIAGRLGFDTRPLRLELHEIPQLKTPCILHWDLSHFVVLKQADAKGIVIHDPAQGVRRLSLAEASKHFTGVALELWPAANFTKTKAREKISLRALAGEVHGAKRALTQILLLALGLEVLV
ncbi:Peptidase C39, bacteriocin processing domain protein, partial [mine drainage metagenome]